MRIELAQRRLRRLGGTLAIAGLAACGSTTQPRGPSNGTMTALIDGSSWAASNIAATYPGGILAIAGTDTQGRSIGFAVGPTTTPGTYPVAVTSAVNASLNIIVGSTAQAWQAVQTSGAGSVTLTAISANRATGTFQFTVVPVAGTGAAGTRSITQGAFDVTY
jgi:hypothetical protein